MEFLASLAIKALIGTSVCGAVTVGTIYKCDKTLLGFAPSTTNTGTLGQGSSGGVVEGSNAGEITKTVSGNTGEEVTSVVETPQMKKNDDSQSRAGIDASPVSEAQTLNNVAVEKGGEEEKIKAEVEGEIAETNKKDEASEGDVTPTQDSTEQQDTNEGDKSSGDSSGISETQGTLAVSDQGGTVVQPSLSTENIAPSTDS